MYDTTSLLARLAAYADHHGLTESQLGRRAVADARAVARIRERRITLRQLDRVAAWLDQAEATA